MTTDKDSLEHVSSLMDGELNRETGMFVVRRLTSDGRLSATWARYHLVRDCIRESGGQLAGDGFAARVRAQLDAEASENQGSATPRWLRPAASLALTATVAAMAVILVQPSDPVGQVPAPAELAVAEPAEAFVAPAGLPLGPVTQPASFSAGNSEERVLLDAYLLRHNQVSQSAARQGFVSFLPVVTQAAREDSVEPVTEQAEPEATESNRAKPQAGPQQ